MVSFLKLVRFTFSIEEVPTALGFGQTKHWEHDKNIAGIRRPHDHSQLWTAKYHNMGLVDIVLSSLLGYEEHFVKQEERSLILCSVDVEGSLEDELTVCSEVRPFPVDEEWLNLLKKMRHRNPWEWFAKGLATCKTTRDAGMGCQSDTHIYDGSSGWPPSHSWLKSA